ncbi:hypothetical protein [Oscillatoria salina]|uniref:hypothetical protein n=1 Tax=Oscillatoria salina TaxID=331517 RepID=UPI0013BDA73A|nr:hypothetical protein [Oscillatoria salina]MBZ8180909.1 hypothetical protein [Oscillatoria salina IIICB1]NET89909.1 hypothetical protein [Kamptonema sp. SIO1D9]
MNNDKYSYVGSQEIRLSVANSPIGTVISSIEDLKKWIFNTLDRRTINSNLIVATFVIDLKGNLRLAERSSEHIACAGGKAVLSAGEIFITWDKGAFEVCDITNQSTGYCPKIDSWKSVETALKKIPISFPPHFTIKFIFRRCPSCSQINIVKNDVFICSVCNSNLPDE